MLPVGLTEETPIALFVAQHRHPPDKCPASSGSGPLLLSRVSAAAAARYGVTIEAEALIDGEHLLLLVVQAASQEAVERFLAFFLARATCGSCRPAAPKTRSSAADAGRHSSPVPGVIR